MLLQNDIRNHYNSAIAVVDNQENGFDVETLISNTSNQQGGQGGEIKSDCNEAIIGEVKNQHNRCQSTPSTDCPSKSPEVTTTRSWL